MDASFSALTSWISDPDILRTVVVVLAAATMFALALGISYFFLGATDPIRRRLRDMPGGTDAGRRHAPRRMVTIQTLMGPIAKYVVPSEEVERSATIRRLVHAGFRNPNALQIFYAAKALLFITLPAIVYAGFGWFPSVKESSVMMYVLAAACAGFLGPSYYVDYHLSKRQRALRVGFPDALDLMVVCVESGLGLTQSIQRVADEIGVSHPELGAELALVNAEMRIGVDSVDALKNFAERTGLEDIRGLVSLLVQTLRFGTGVADALRVYAEEFRDKRMQAAEELAAKMGTKMIFPLVFFMFPGFFVVAIGPAVIKLIEAFSRL